MSTARNFNLKLLYNGKDISRDVAIFVESFNYVDRTLPDKMDEISVTFQDVPGLWRGDWFPDRGAKFAAKISVDNWFKPNDHYDIDCGVFEIDDLSSSGLPSTFTIGAISVGITNSIRRQQNTKAWDSMNLKDIANELAGKNGFELKWYSNYNPVLPRWEKKSESDLSCLKKLCEHAGLTLKITNKSIVIFSSEEFDSKKPDIKIRIKDDGVKSYSFNANSSDIYSACEVKYFDSKEGNLIEYLFVPNGTSGIKGGENDVSDPEVGQVLKINQRVESVEKAEVLAKSKLRNANMRQLKGSLTLIGRPDLYSGMNIKLEGFGRWDSSTWNIEEVSHEYSVSGGYSSALQLRGVLGF